MYVCIYIHIYIYIYIYIYYKERKFCNLTNQFDFTIL